MSEDEIRNQTFDDVELALTQLIVGTDWITHVRLGMERALAEVRELRRMKGAVRTTAKR